MGQVLIREYNSGVKFLKVSREKEKVISIIAL